MHKVVIKVLKVLRKKHENELCLFERDTDPEDVLSPQSYRITWAFHSYVLKTMFLQEWTKLPENSYWAKDQLRIRIKGILKRIRTSVKRRNIRSFWVSEYKLFNFRARNATDTRHCEAKLSDLLEKLKL